MTELLKKGVKFVWVKHVRKPSTPWGNT
jgi:hypothetical protein